jgi:hypothetical protein
VIEYSKIENVELKSLQLKIKDLEFQMNKKEIALER